MQVAIQDGYTVISAATYSRELAAALKREFPKPQTGLKWHPDRQVFTLSTKYYQRARSMFDVPSDNEAPEDLAGTRAMQIKASNITRSPDRVGLFLIDVGQPGDEIVISEQTLRDYERDSGMIRISRMSHYAALGIEQEADDRAITKAYKAMARRVHPDLNKGAAWAVKSTQLLNESYEILNAPMKRARYDVGLQMARVTMANQEFAPYCTSGRLGIAYTLLEDGSRKAVKILEWLPN